MTTLLLQIALGCFRTQATILGTMPLNLDKDSIVQSCFKHPLIALRTSSKTVCNSKMIWRAQDEADSGELGQGAVVVFGFPLHGWLVCDARDCPKCVKISPHDNYTIALPRSCHMSRVSISKHSLYKYLEFKGLIRVSGYLTNLMDPNCSRCVNHENCLRT